MPRGFLPIFFVIILIIKYLNRAFAENVAQLHEWNSRAR